jgi:hypothetical protein
MASGTLQVEARGPFSLARSVAFAGGFAPAGAPQADGDACGWRSSTTAARRQQSRPASPARK